ncbi:MAG: hypothetical protein LBG19_09865 [Prevotellaceae bacterium]|jgi:hypothetical protein|nr:hypothetical protein [Prevotellaceae bacterium]
MGRWRGFYNALAATATFGTETWDAVSSFAYIDNDEDDPAIAVKLYSTDYNKEGKQYPYLDFKLVGNTVGIYDVWISLGVDGNYDINYFEKNFIPVNEDEEFGDWWVDEDFPRAIEITKIENSKISGIVNFTMIDIFALIDDGVVINKELHVEFSDIPLTDITLQSGYSLYSSRVTVKNKALIKK